jgi:hypothetical protein
MNIIIDMLKNHLYQDINDFLLNLLLVKYKARNAYLLESANFINSEYSVFDMLNLSKTIGFLITKDITSLPNYPRYWISIEKLNKVPETDEEIGTLLGMKNPGGDYYNYKNKRLYLYINEEKTGVNITTELVLVNINDIDNKQFAINKISKQGQQKQRNKHSQRMQQLHDNQQTMCKNNKSCDDAHRHPIFNHVAAFLLQFLQVLKQTARH